MSNLSEAHLLFTGVSLAPCHGAVGLNMARVDVVLCVNFLEAGKFLESLTPHHCEVYRVGCVFQLPSIGHSVVLTLPLKWL